MPDRETINRMVSIAQLYYLHNLPRSEIAQRLGMSRQMVSKLLEQAQTEGFIDIKIIDPFDLNNQLSNKLKEITGLKDVIVVPSPKSQTDLIKRNIGLVGADYVARKVFPGNVIGLGWGKTLNEMIRSFPQKNVSHSYIVPMIGGIGRIEPDLQVNNLAMILSRKIGGTPLLLYAPAILDTAPLYQSMLESSSSVIEFWDKIDIALVGIGVAGRDVMSDIVYKGYESYSERLSLETTGAVGDIGMHFFDINGQAIETQKTYKISMGLEKIKKVPTVIGMAGGLHKLRAIRGAITGHLINVLITDEFLAQELLADFIKTPI